LMGALPGPLVGGVPKPPLGGVANGGEVGAGPGPPPAGGRPVTTVGSSCRLDGPLAGEPVGAPLWPWGSPAGAPLWPWGLPAGAPLWPWGAPEGLVGAPLAGDVDSAGTQNCHPGGAGGQLGSGVQPGGGCQPSGCDGHPGGGLNFQLMGGCLSG